MIKILFWSNFGMQISAKIWDYWDFTWIEIILPRLDKNIDKDTNLIKFWNANIGKNLGLLKK